MTDEDFVAVADHSNKVALNRDGMERIEVPGNALAFKLNSTTDNNKNGGDSTDQTNDEQIFPDSEAVHGFITTVAARSAVPRFGDDQLVAGMLYNVPRQTCLTPEQGDDLMNQYNNVGESWLCNPKLMNLPEPVAKTVREFLKPEPVHFFEPGDLWIRFTYFETKLQYREHTNDGHPALIVARRA